MQKTYVYVLTEIWLQWSKWFCPKVVNVISDIGHGAQKVARKAAKEAEPIIRGSAAQWRKTVGEAPKISFG